MVRFGLYDAYDKWEILRRYWADPNSVDEEIVDKWNSPALRSWHDMALAGGLGACVEYMDAKLLSLQQTPNTSIDEAPLLLGKLNQEIANLDQRLETHRVKYLAHELGDAITRDRPATGGIELSPQLVERLRAVFKQGALSLLRWTDMAGEVPSIEIMRLRSNHFPVHAIKQKKQILSLFGALNYGRSDVIHIYDSCPEHVTLVDIAEDCLNDMRLIYPKEWTYICADFHDFLTQATADQHSYDLIVADTYRMWAREVAWDLLPTMMGMCSDTFITNYFIEMFDELGVVPDDVDGLSRAIQGRTGVDAKFTQVIPRNDAVFWTIMKKSSSA